MKRVYISHAYGGKEENKRDIEKLVKQLINLHEAMGDNEHYMPISPVHAFGYLYKDVSYQEGINWCLQLLKHCDALLITGENWQESKGVKIEIAYARKNGIPIYRLKDDFDVVMLDGEKEVF